MASEPRPFYVSVNSADIEKVVVDLEIAWNELGRYISRPRALVRGKTHQTASTLVSEEKKRGQTPYSRIEFLIMGSDPFSGPVVLVVTDSIREIQEIVAASESLIV